MPAGPVKPQWRVTSTCASAQWSSSKQQRCKGANGATMAGRHTLPSYRLRKCCLIAVARLRSNPFVVRSCLVAHDKRCRDQCQLWAESALFSGPTLGRSSAIFRSNSGPKQCHPEGQLWAAFARSTEAMRLAPRTDGQHAQICRLATFAKTWSRLAFTTAVSYTHLTLPTTPYV